MEHLITREITAAKYSLISFEQRRCQGEEFTLLNQQHELPKSSSPRNFCPFFDPDSNIMRVGGRLRNSEFNELRKFPLFMPKESPLVSLMIRHFHEKTFHGGGQLTHASI